MSKTLIGIVVAVLIVGAAVFYFQSKPVQAPTESMTPPPDTTMQQDNGTTERMIPKEMTAKEVVAGAEATDSDGDGLSNADDNCDTAPNPDQADTDGDGLGDACESEVTIEVISGGFSPQTVTVEAGTKVTWINKTTSTSWPATAIHPTHTVYPGSDIKKCGLSEESKIFDACRELKPGGSYSFVFSERGTWAYHDHVKSGRFGKVVVE